jgi:prepilin-type N-terminal cleavage/methylation domain-containing protein
MKSHILLKALAQAPQKKSGNEGFTLIELLVVLIFGAIVVICGLGFLSAAFRSQDVGKTKEMAKNWMMDTYPRITDVGVSCTGRDTTADGYISCDASGTRDGKLIEVSLNCAGPFTLNRGCKRKVLVIPGQPQ